ncbi:hypothetical protein PARPLA_01361 [Rhodobacteraceae bacterium THAF1]|uniref:lipopolysaccharide assembly protein LapA domain-containing protein n=1 Tax=Palleronia sp. THAF1 TaxID=2587842 RepID=UPI000F40868D|nr:LapA family protein [Palleronia sp. THAF1]QFU09457.1 hypothetical protein FIU81_12295 [Palleronia sp. THAF1]VDC21873.1 hypothetical protein PARPLA_01361 [Rhodobacteraceae bacterium THAF1]
MRIVKFVLLAIVAILLLIVALANAQEVTLRVLPEAMAGFMGISWTITLPMFVVILGAVVVGLLIGFLWEYAREHKHRRAARTERREREVLEREVTQMKREKPGKGNDILALLEDGSTPTRRAS